MLISGTNIRGGNYYGAISSTPAVVTDPYFNYVSLLLPGDGFNGAQNNTFVDSSTNNFTITRYGNTTQGTSSPYSPAGWSSYFSAAGQYLSIADDPSLRFDLNNFTVEFWVNPGSFSGLDWSTLFNKGYTQSAGTGGFLIQIDIYYQIQVFLSGGISLGGTSPLPANKWSHVAVVRSGNTFTRYVNGVQSGSGTSSLALNSSSVVEIGTASGTSANRHYISNLRVVIGDAVYTTNFTPPTAPLTAITNTRLLTCQSNRFVDNSNNNFAITANGDVKVTNSAPFAPTQAWSADANGGSAYFDGTGDYLTAPDNAAFSLMSGDFTIESWFYLTATPNPTYGAPIVCKNGVSSGWLVRAYSNRMSWVYPGTTEYLWGPTVNLLNRWYHVAVVKSGSTITGYLNGVGYTITTSIASETSETVKIGSDTNGYTTGFISDVRIVKGTAVYTSNFTPPTAPVTAVANTSLLLNFTNGGITDASTKNILETIGSNIKISTSVVKYGTGSISDNGVKGSYLSLGSSMPLNLQLSSGDFTVECWVYLNGTSTYSVIGNLDNQTGTTSWHMILNSTYISQHGVQFACRGGVFRFGTTTLATATWQHIAVSCSGTSIRCFVNGIQLGTTQTVATSGAGTLTNPMWIGASYDTLNASAYTLDGYIDDLRVTQGIARYTADFTPPTAAFPTQ